MKETITIIRDHGNSNAGESTAAQGRNGDTQLAHVNNWEAKLLRMLGGSGTVNPKTGLREFANPYDENVAYWGGPEKYATAIMNKLTSGQALADPTNAGYFMKDNPNLFNTGNAFNFPTDIMPTTTSGTVSSGRSDNQSYTGLPSSYQSSLLEALMPALNSSTSNMEGNINTYTNQAQQSYKSLLDNAMKERIPKTISELANRGIIDSTAGSDILSTVISEAAKDATQKQYQTAMQAALLKANMPSVLSQIAELGKSSTSQGNTINTGTSLSYSQDPTQMYQIMANMIMSMM